MELFEKATSLEDLIKRLGDLPSSFGSWSVVRSDKGYAQIINEYEEYGCLQADKEDTDIRWDYQD